VSCNSNSNFFSAFPLGLCNGVSIDFESMQVDIADLQLTFPKTPDGQNPVPLNPIFLNGGLSFP
jgi:hypothetical protein